MTAATEGPIARLMRFPDGVGTEIAWNAAMTPAQSSTFADASPDRISAIAETVARTMISKNKRRDRR